MIAAADAQRSVAITLQLVADQRNKAVASDTNKIVESAEKAATKVTETESRKRADAFIASLKERDESMKKYISSAASADKKRAEDFEKLTNRMEASWTHVEKRQTSATERESNKREEKREKELEKQKQQLDSLERTRVDSQRRATEAGVGALQGTMDLVEGAALLGITSEENFEKFAKGFVKVQAGFKVMRGFTELVWKGREALVAMRAATQAQSAANALLTNSNYRTAASQAVMNTAAGAAGIGGSGGAGLGAVGVAGTGVTLGGAATAGAAIAGAAAAGLVAFEGFQALRRGIFGASDSTESFVGALISYNDALKEVEESSKRLEMAHKRTAEQEKRLAERAPVEARLYESRQVERGSFALRRQVEFEISGGNRDPIKNATEQRNQAAIAYRDAEAEHQRVLQRNRELFKLGQAQEQDHEAAVRTARQLEESGNRLLDTSRQRLQVLRDQSRAADEQLETLEGQKKSVRAQYDRLSPGRQDRFKEISKRYSEGGIGAINQSDVRFLERIGLGGEIVTEFRSGRAVDSGSDEALRNAGEFRGIDKRVAEAEDQKKRATAATIRAAEADAREKARRQQESREGRVRAEGGAAAAQRGKLLRDKIKTEKEKADEKGPETTLLNELFFNPSRNFPGEIYNSGAATGAAEASLSPLLFFGRSVSDRVRQSVGGEDKSQRAAGDAADQVTQSGIGVEQAIKILLDAVTKTNDNLVTQIEDSKLLEKSYS